MPTLLTPDICVIGTGPGGAEVAATAAMFGAPVVLVGKNPAGAVRQGHAGLASAALAAAARLAHVMRAGAPFGIAPAEPDVDAAAVARHVRSALAATAPGESAERLTALGVRVIEAEGRFTGKRLFAAGDFEIRARRFVVAAGSVPLIPDIPGLGEIDCLTGESMVSLTRRPGHLAILGAGRTGCELAQAWRRLGAEVTLIDSTRALGHEDPELAAFALRRLAAEGVVLRQNTAVTSVARRGRTGVRLELLGDAGTETVDATHLLLATGRRPDIDGLGLDAARIRFGPGGIAVNARLRTSNRRVYAIGDVAGAARGESLAAHHGSLVLRPLLFRLPARARPQIVPRVVFTDPEIAQVGLTEAEARAAGHPVTILRWPLAENHRAQAERATGGLVKLVVGRRGRILGAGIAGPVAGEAIHTFALAAARGLRVADIAAYVAPLPTFGEAGRRAALSHSAAIVRSPLVRGLVALLRRLG